MRFYIRNARTATAAITAAILVVCGHGDKKNAEVPQEKVVSAVGVADTAGNVPSSAPAPRSCDETAANAGERNDFLSQQRQFDRVQTAFLKKERVIRDNLCHHDMVAGDIYIHGACATSGCLPMTNDKIKEIYLYAVYARNNGQVNIPVYIFPFRMTDENFRSYQNKYSDDRALLDFWANLKTGYDKFMLDKKALAVSVSADGDYLFQSNSNRP